MPAKASKPKFDWVVMGGKHGEVGYCTRCGEGLQLVMPISLDLFCALTDAFVKLHSKCKLGGYVEKPAATPLEWLNGRDTGTSSMTIFRAITGMPVPRDSHYDIPHDAADFGRCYRLLKLFPAWRPQLPKVIDICPKWRPYVEAWDELTELYEQELTKGSAPKLYARMKQLEVKS
jgi:hypothetical protein